MAMKSVSWRKPIRVELVPKSGVGAKDVNVKLSENFPYLSWIDPNFVERQTDTDFQYQMHLEDEQEEQQDGDDNISTASTDV